MASSSLKRVLKLLPSVEAHVRLGRCWKCGSSLAIKSHRPYCLSCRKPRKMKPITLTILDPME